MLIKMLRKKGFYGEGIPWEGQRVLTIKTHGHTTGEGALADRKNQLQYNHMQEVFFGGEERHS